MVKWQIAETDLLPASQGQTNSGNQQGKNVTRSTSAVHQNQTPGQRNPVEVPTQESVMQKASLWQSSAPQVLIATLLPSE